MSELTMEKQYPETVEELISRLEEEFPQNPKTTKAMLEGKYSDWITVKGSFVHEGKINGFEIIGVNPHGNDEVICKEIMGSWIGESKNEKLLSKNMYLKVRDAALKNNKKSVYWRIKPEVMTRKEPGSKIQTTMYARAIFI